MATEIERKFLVKGDFNQQVVSSQRIVQGYICSHPDRTVRIRICGKKGYLTIKGSSDEKGLSRYEFEQEIPLSDAEILLKLCEPGVIDKIRHLIPIGSHIWEVDVFHGDNEGLILAEIELTSEEDSFELPEWLDIEVSGDRRYYNSMLAKYPYSQWGKNNLKI